MRQPQDDNRPDVADGDESDSDKRSWPDVGKGVNVNEMNVIITEWT